MVQGDISYLLKKRGCNECNRTWDATTGLVHIPAPEFELGFSIGLDSLPLAVRRARRALSEPVNEKSWNHKRWSGIARHASRRACTKIWQGWYSWLTTRGLKGASSSRRSRRSQCMGRKNSWSRTSPCIHSTPPSRVRASLSNSWKQNNIYNWFAHW